MLSWLQSVLPDMGSKQPSWTSRPAVSARASDTICCAALRSSPLPILRETDAEEKESNAAEEGEDTKNKRKRHLRLC